MFKFSILMMAVLLLVPILWVSVTYADPTKPSQNMTKEQALTQIRQHTLSAIIVTDSGRKAVIDGKVFLEAQHKEGLTVTHIGQKKVKIKFLHNGEWVQDELTLTDTSFVTQSGTDK